MLELPTTIDENCASCAALLEVGAAQQAFIAQQQEAIERLEARVAQLEERLGTDSSNSAPKSRAQRRKRPHSGRARGGQKCERALVPLEQVDTLHVVVPTTCRGCGDALADCDDAPHRHQVTELPPVVPVVTEYQLHALSCGYCGTKTRASLPVGVPTGASAPG